MKVIADQLSSHERPLVAWSGGKDASVVMDLVNRLMSVPAYNDCGFMYERANADTQRTADERGWAVTYDHARSWQWLKAHDDMVFAEDSSLRSRFYSANQQRGVRLHAKATGTDLMFFGRRHQENSIKSPVYLKDGRTQCHPIASWTTEDVWVYLRSRDFDVPWLYQTHHGRWFGYNKFTSVRASVIDGSSKLDCWNYVAEYDPTITPQRLEQA